MQVIYVVTVTGLVQVIYVVTVTGSVQVIYVVTVTGSVQVIYVVTVTGLVQVIYVVTVTGSVQVIYVVTVTGSVQVIYVVTVTGSVQVLSLHWDQFSNFCLTNLPRYYLAVHFQEMKTSTLTLLLLKKTYCADYVLSVQRNFSRFLKMAICYRTSKRETA